jgi:hypothetical protein
MTRVIEAIYVRRVIALFMRPHHNFPASRWLKPAWAVIGLWLMGAGMQGAEGKSRMDDFDWWSLKPIGRPALPEVRSPILATRVRNPVDRFIFARLEQEGLTPSPEADRRTLIRRVYFDLTGLPPTPEAVDAFVVDPAQDAYERLVDRLLESPQYGERWARHWLDVVHYGETHGYDKDQPRPNAWPYRDYVIRAFNADKPYGRFVQEQVAGDALWPDTEDGITALGFIAAGPWDFIGHVEVPETKTDGKIARLLDRDDMVGNVMNTFCSTTIQCARCHNHKFDPVSSEDYYRLTAVFAALDRADRRFDRDPAITRERASLESRQRELKSKAKALENKLTGLGGRRLELIDRLLADLHAGPDRAERPEFGWHSQIEARPDAIKWVQVDLGTSVALERIVYAACRDDFNGIGDGFGFPLRFRIEASDDAAFTTGVSRLEDQTGADVPNPGVTPRELRPAGVRARYLRITATKLAPRQNDFIFALAELQVLDAGGRNLALGADVTASDSIEAEPRWGRRNLTDGYFFGFAKTAVAPSPAQLEAQRQELLARLTDDGTRASLESTRAELTRVEASLARLPPAQVVYAGTIHQGSGAFRGTGPDGGKPRPIFLLNRGDVNKPTKEVTPGTVRFLGDDGIFAIPGDAPESARRVALARWLTDPRNPLTWRSIVNRVWQYHFGRALADSPNDFGRMGQKPSHPELLDWLAAGFRDGGQSLKALHRLLVTSSTYRQQSVISEPVNSESDKKSRHTSGELTTGSLIAESQAQQRDADNRLLWRMNRRKLEAEAIRDSVLLVAGKLDPAMGGPSFQDFVVERPEHSPHYEYRLHDPESPKAQRRSIYRFIVRSQPQPFMSTLDCADPSMSVDRRNETLNALQALALLNNQLTVAMARHFAEQVETGGGSIEAAVTRAFRLALARSPNAAELRSLTEFARQNGLANTCRVILNLNEFAFVD